MSSEQQKPKADSILKKVCGNVTRQTSPVEVLNLMLDKETLQQELERERAEKQALLKSVTDPVPTTFDRLFRSEIVDVSAIEVHYMKLCRRTNFLEASNKELLLTLQGVRSQLANVYSEHFKKLQEIKILEASLKKANGAAGAPQRQDQAELIESMSKEIEKLKAQKEDIVNHSRNSEKMWNERICCLTAQFERAMTTDLKQSKEEEAGELRKKLEQQLKEAQESIAEKEMSNRVLQIELVHTNDKKAMLERQNNINQVFVLSCQQDRQAFIEERKQYEAKSASINEEMKELEEMATSLRQKFEDVTEKLNTQSITFANEKAKFCHDLESIEEKWNSEVVKLREQNEALVKEQEEAREQFFKEQRISEAMADSYKWQLRDAASEMDKAAAEHATAIEEWEDECTALENEIYVLIEKRKTEAKQMATLKRKNFWLSKSIKKLAQQRRDEIELKNDDIEMLRKRCSSINQESMEFLLEMDQYKKDLKIETEERVKLNAKLEKLQRTNDDLEDKVDAVTDKWRSECDAYETTMSILLEKHEKELDECDSNMHAEHLEKEKLYETIRRLEEANSTLQADLEQQRIESIGTLEQTVLANNAAMSQLKASTEREKFAIMADKNEVIYSLQRKIAAMDKTVHYEKIKNEESQRKLLSMHEKIDDLSLDRDLLDAQVEKLKIDNTNLCTNMGVKEIEEEDSDDSDESESSSDESDDDESDAESFDKLSCGQCSDAGMFDDMPELKDEREETSAASEQKQGSTEWEVVEDKEV